MWTKILGNFIFALFFSFSFIIIVRVVLHFRTYVHTYRSLVVNMYSYDSRTECKSYTKLKAFKPSRVINVALLLINRNSDTRSYFLFIYLFIYFFFFLEFYYYELSSFFLSFFYSVYTPYRLLEPVRYYVICANKYHLIITNIYVHCTYYICTYVHMYICMLVLKV